MILLRLIHLNYDLSFVPGAGKYCNSSVRRVSGVNVGPGGDRWSDKVMRHRWLTLSQLGEVHLQKMQIGWTEP